MSVTKSAPPRIPGARIASQPGPAKIRHMPRRGKLRSQRSKRSLGTRRVSRPARLRESCRARFGEREEHSNAHSKYVFGYILYAQGVGAWTWSLADASVDGIYGRSRAQER